MATFEYHEKRTAFNASQRGILTRRKALLFSGATAALTGSALAGGSPAQATDPVGTTQPTTSLTEQFLAQPQFVIAHRGAGDVNPEHTSYAYQRAILKGAQAIEISVRCTLDGQLVCMHDNALRRITTEKTGYVSSITLAELKRAMVDTRDFLGSGTPLVNITTLTEALDVIKATATGGAFGSVGPNAVLFIEAKDAGAQAQLLEVLQDRGLQDQVVIKIYRNGAGGFDPESGFAKYAKNLGFKTWCYFDANDSLANIRNLVRSSYVDLVGVPFFETVNGRTYASMTDSQISAVVALGKPVIAWETHRRSVRERLAALGVRGFMSPNPYWLAGGGTSPDLALAAGRRLDGMLPAGQQDVANMPVWEKGALIHRQTYDESMLLGPLSHRVETSGGSYVVYFNLHWENSLPSTDWQYGYVAFGRTDDSPFGIGGKFDLANPNAGAYVLAVRPHAAVIDEKGAYRTGDLVQLLRFDAGNSVPVPLATVALKTPLVADQDITCKIIVRPETITFEADGIRSPAVTDAQYRGSFIHFGRYHGNDVGGGLALSNVVTYKI
ncbi:MAG: glycerophosphodiester phosphodiesterase family protein [Rothia sp. (in: high G+C Gram-positive bacteria)]|nr:glycerophosphodiester phosphodiesterase family protein [Rothia sp. (in: high G+C Gram-positive bacteria)]